MSRIHEALKRAARGGVDPNPAPAGDIQPSADLSTIERYVPESGTSRVAAEAPTDPRSTRRFEVPTFVREPPESAEDSRAHALDGIPTRACTVTTAAVSTQQLQVAGGWRQKLVTAEDAHPDGILQYRRLSSAVAQWKRDARHDTLLFTSARRHEGRTLSAVNLALTLSESYGRHVLLIDADPLHPSLHTILPVHEWAGLSDVLRSGGNHVPVVDVTAHLAVLPAGRPDSESTRALTSERMKRVLHQVADQFDWILLDGPPVGRVTDSGLAEIAGAVLFVIGAGSTPRRAAAAAMTQLGREYIVGTILNRVARSGNVPCVAR